MKSDAHIRADGRLLGREAYEASVAMQPTYHDGTPRKEWEALGELERWSWSRPLRIDAPPRKPSPLKVEA